MKLYTSSLKQQIVCTQRFAHCFFPCKFTIIVPTGQKTLIFFCIVARETIQTRQTIYFQPHRTNKEQNDEEMSKSTNCMHWDLVEHSLLLGGPILTLNSKLNTTQFKHK